MKARSSVVFVAALVLASFQAPVAWAYPRGNQADPN